MVQFFVFLLALIGLKIFEEKGSEFNRNRQRKKYISFMMWVFIFQSGLRRHDVGPDTGGYMRMFYETLDTPWSFLTNDFIAFINYDEGKDPGYFILSKVFGEFFPSYQLFLIFIAIIFFLGLGKVLYKYLNTNEEVLVALGLYQSLYYGFMSITGHRQTIATGLLLFAVPFILDKKWIKAAALFLLAITQHKSAILFGGFFLLPFVKEKHKMILAGSFVAFPIMMSAGTRVASFFIEDTRMEQYAEFLEYYEGAGAYFFAAFILLLGACLWWKGKYLAQINNNNKVFMCAIAVAIMLTPLTMINQSNMRIVQYYSIFTLIVLPLFLTVYQKNVKINYIHYLFFIFFALYTIIKKPIPYYFFWQ